MTGRFVWQLPTCIHGRLSHRVLSALEHLEALTSTATQGGPSSELSAALSFLLSQAARLFRGIFQRRRTTSKPSQTSSLGPPCQEGMPEALAWVAWASNDIERRTSKFRLHRHLHSLTTYCKVQGWRRVVQGQTVRQAGRQMLLLSQERASLGHYSASIRDWLPMPMDGPYSATTTIKSCFVREGKSLAAAETNEPVGLEGHAALSIIKCLFFTGHGNIVGLRIAKNSLSPLTSLLSLCSGMRWRKSAKAIMAQSTSPLL